MMKNKKTLMLIGILISVTLLLFIFPYISTGIMNNDELRHRLLAMSGTFNFSKSIFRELVHDKGRAISAFILPITIVTEFIGKSTYSFKAFQFFIIIVNITFFCKLIKSISKNETLSKCLFILLLLFLPISFEPMLPNAYVGVYGIPLAFMFVSFDLFYHFLNDGKRKKNIWSMCLFFIACCSYEAFVTYAVVYVGLALYYTVENKTSMKEFIRKAGIPIVIACIYLALYVFLGKLFPSQYEGNKIGFEIKSSLKIILELLKTSLPGGLLLSGKYRFLYEYYKKNLNPIDIVRLLSIGIIFCGLMIIIVREYSVIKKDNTKKSSGKIVIDLVLIFICSILPFIPISVSKMYQGNVGDSGFVQLPVSYFAYFFTSLAMAYILNFFLSKNGVMRKVGCLCLVLVLSLGIKVQTWNAVFAKEMNSDFCRIENIEKLFETDMMKKLDGANIYSNDIFNVHNGLAVHSNYWQDYINILGYNMQVIQGINESDGFSIFETDSSTFTMVNNTDGSMFVFSKEKLISPKAIKISENEFEVYVNNNEENRDNDFFVYYVEV